MELRIPPLLLLLSFCKHKTTRQMPESFKFPLQVETGTRFARAYTIQQSQTSRASAVPKCTSSHPLSPLALDPGQLSELLKVIVTMFPTRRDHILVGQVVEPLHILETQSNIFASLCHHPTWPTCPHATPAWSLRGQTGFSHNDGNVGFNLTYLKK